MSNIEFVKEGTEQYFEHLKNQNKYDFIKKPEIILLEENNEIRASLNFWDSNGYSYSLQELNLLIDLLTKSKDTIVSLTQTTEISNASEQIERTRENSPESSPELRTGSEVL